MKNDENKMKKSRICDEKKKGILRIWNVNIADADKFVKNVDYSIEM